MGRQNKEKPKFIRSKERRRNGSRQERIEAYVVMTKGLKGL